MNALKKVLLTLAIILLFLLLIGLLCFKLAITDVDSDMYKAQASANLPAEFAKAVILENNYTIPEEDLNNYIAYLISGMATPASSGDDFRVSEFYIDLKANEPNRCYMRVTNDSFTFSFAADCDIHMENNEIVFKLSDFSVGKLPVSDSIASYFINRVDMKTMGAYVNADALEARFPTHYGINVPDIGELVSIDIVSIDISDSGINAQTNPVISDSLGNVADILIDRFGEYASQFVN